MNNKFRTIYRKIILNKWIKARKYDAKGKLFGR